MRPITEKRRAVPALSGCLTLSGFRQRVPPANRRAGMRKDRLDGTGLAALVGITLLLAANQIVIKDANRGLQPVFFAGARSVLATGFVWLWRAIGA